MNYYISNHGSRDKPMFRDHADFEHFLALLYIGNATGHFILRDAKAAEIFALGRSVPLVSVKAYCLLPDRYHLILSDRAPNGIRRFIHKIDTAYVMYYNRRHGHRGTVFPSKYRMKHISDESGLYELVRRVHLFPFSVQETESNKNSSTQPFVRLGARSSGGLALDKMIDLASRYEYSSMKDYLGEDRPQKVILEGNRD